MDDTPDDKPIKQQDKSGDKIDWNIPPAGERGDVPWLDRQVIQKGFGKQQAVWVARATEAKEKELLELLDETCSDLKIKNKPKLLIYDHEQPNAYSNTFTGVVAFSTNILEIMPREEVKAVMGHELTHNRHRKRDIITQYSYIVAALAGALDVHNVIGPHHINSSNYLIATAEVDLGMNAAAIPLLAWSRQREKEADDGGVKSAGKENMISSLQTLDKRTEEIKETAATIGIRRKTPAEWRLTHPKTENRIERIKNKHPDEKPTEPTSGRTK